LRQADLPSKQSYRLSKIEKLKLPYAPSGSNRNKLIDRITVVNELDRIGLFNDAYRIGSMQRGMTDLRHATLCYKPEGRAFDSRRGGFFQFV
jgi:hypothetical protein